MTQTQINLYNILLLYMTTKSPMLYDSLKALTEFKTFDSTFNALLNKGYVKRFKEGNGVNDYILTTKSI
jgi:hypothetical protein